jgi:hypothetical protein
MSSTRVLGFALIAVGGLALAARLSPPVSAGWWSGEARLLETRDERLELDGVERVVVEAGAGSLVLRGSSRSDGRLVAELHGPDEAVRKELELSHRVDGRSLIVEARTGDARNARIDLELDLPSRLELKVADGSGSAAVEGCDGDVSVTDGSGSLRLERLGGALRVVDGSGSLDVRTVAGDVTITDGAGSIDVEDVGGTVAITDGSGSIEVVQVGGDVRVTDGSGPIGVRDVDGAFRLLGDGSGSVRTSGVRGGTGSRVF